MGLYPELDDLSFDELVKRFQGPPPEGDEYAFVYYSEVALNLSKKGPEGTDFLQDRIGTADTEHLRAILFALAEPLTNDPAMRELLLSFLQDHRPMIVMEAVDALALQGETDALDRVLNLLEHSSPYVRGSVLRYMRRLHPDRAMPILMESLEDEHPIVRAAAADEAGELGKAEAVLYLHRLLTDPDPDVRQAAQTAIEILDG